MWQLHDYFSYIRSDQSLSRVRLFATPWITACQAFLFFTISRSFLKLISIESAMPSNHLILCHPLSPFAFNLCLHQGLFQLVAFHIKEPKCESFSFSVSPSNEYSGLISFRIDWFDLLAVQGTLKSIFQHHSSKHQFFGAQLSLWSRSHIHTCMDVRFLINAKFLLIYHFK